MTTVHTRRAAAHTTQPRRITWYDLASDPALLAALVDAYRTVFGGPEWREWTRCTHPDCLRQYSSDEARRLRGICACGRVSTLVPFHFEQDVIRCLQRHLADPAQSCCFLWTDRTARVDAFCWGYRAPLSMLADDLATDNMSGTRITAHLGRYLDSIRLDPLNTPLCRFAEAGVAQPHRDTGLTWAMGGRLLAWAADLHTSVVIVRTSHRSPMHAVCGALLGMQVIHDYAGMDDRVILAGTVAELQHALDSGQPSPTR